MPLYVKTPNTIYGASACCAGFNAYHLSCLLFKKVVHSKNSPHSQIFLFWQTHNISPFIKCRIYLAAIMDIVTFIAVTTHIQHNFPRKFSFGNRKIIENIKKRNTNWLLSFSIFDRNRNSFLSLLFKISRMVHLLVFAVTYC